MTTDLAWRVRANQRERRTFDVRSGPEDDIDVTGWTVDAKVRSRPGGTVLHTIDIADITITGSQVAVVIPAPISAAWAFTTGWYRIRVVDPASDVDDPEASRVLQGPFVVDPD